MCVIIQLIVMKCLRCRHSFSSKTEKKYTQSVLSYTGKINPMSSILSLQFKGADAAGLKSAIIQHLGPIEKEEVEVGNVLHIPGQVKIFQY